MTNKDSTSGPSALPVATPVADDSDPLASVGNFILGLIRKAATQETTLDAPLRERIKALESQIGHYEKTEH
jgi:hypothetical protein